jgi:hypothetical protein
MRRDQIEVSSYKWDDTDVVWVGRDKPLHGDRRGQRSIRLSQAYRAIYIETSSGEIELVEILEVTKHEY